MPHINKDFCPKNAMAEQRKLNKQIATKKIVAIARNIKAARDERHKRTVAIQKMATEARRTGVSQAEELKAFDNTPVVWDIGDLVEDLCEAIDELDIAIS